MTKKATMRLIDRAGVDGARLFIDLLNNNRPPQEISRRVLPYMIRERERKEARTNG